MFFQGVEGNIGYGFGGIVRDGACASWEEAVSVFMSLQRRLEPSGVRCKLLSELISESCCFKCLIFKHVRAYFMIAGRW